MKRYLVAGVSALAIFGPLSIRAQTPHASATRPPVKRGAVIEEVVVTAQRRTQSIQKTPIAIDAISGATLVRAGVTDATSLTKLLPSVQITEAGHADLFYVRGVGSLVGNSLADPSVALSIDGVFLARPYELPGNFYDLARVEVLEGPQGTLYGRNATGGAINLITNKPAFKNSGDLTVDIGNYNLFRTSGDVNLQLSNTLAVRGAFQATSRHGYLSDGTDDDVGQSGRLQALYKPNDQLSIDLSGDYTHNGGKGSGAIEVNNFSQDQRVAATDPRVRALLAQSLQTDLPYDNHVHDHLEGVAATINYKTDYGTITLLPALRHSDIDFAFANGFQYADKERESQYSTELRFASTPGKPVTFVAGGYFLDELAKTDISVLTGIPFPTGLGQRQGFRATTRAYAGFADGTWNILPHVRLLGGVRYTSEQKTASGFLTLDTGVPLSPLDASVTYDKVNYRVGAEADLLKDTLLYATIATGFHSGGFFFTADNPAYRPETIKAYTIGVKSRFLDRRLLLNVEAFRWDFANEQFSHLIFDSSGAAVFATQNVGSTRIQGIDLVSQAQLTPDTVIGANVQYLDSTYVKFRYDQPIIPPTTGCGVTTAFQRTGPLYTVDCSGRTPPQSPKWSVSLSGQHTIALPNGDSVLLNVRSHYQTSSLTQFDFLGPEYQRPYWMTDLSTSYQFGSGKYDVTAYVNNVTDETVISGSFVAPFAGILPPGHPGPSVISSQILAPRLFGVRLTAHF